ncbi:MAG TPA: HEAT repeat domain-containing protein, partial [Phytomonospora sp.]
MEPEHIADEIASTDPGVREAALERLSSAGAEAVAPLVAVLCDEDSPVEWSRPAVILRRLGDAAFDPLVEAIATAPTVEVARRAGWAFCGLEVASVERYLPALRHPAPKVRGNAAYVLQLKGRDARPYVGELLPLLTDPDADVRQRARWALTEIGPGGVVPRLKSLRRKGKTPELRRQALTALAEVAGPAKFDPADLALLRRLIAVKLPAERAEPMHLCGHWWALPTADQAAVLDAFGLSAPEPVTMRLGGSIWNLDHHESGGGVHGSCARVYVSPAFDGWTLVFGDSSADGHREAPVAERCAELSRRFGRAHWYGQSCGDDWNAWC